jgi:FkbM family methyltransferase
MKIVFSVISVVCKNNSLWRIPFIIIRAAFYVYYQRFTGKIISKTIFNGKQIFLFPFCPVSSMFYYAPIPDKEEIALLRKHSDDHTVFIDIGANIGSYSIMMMDIVKDIIAFEPHPLTASRCKMNFLLNGYDDNKVKQIALNDVNANVTFTDYGNGSSLNRIVSGAESGITVEAKTLDSFFGNISDNRTDNYLIKIDVEGSELNVINGSSHFLKTRKINGIIFECFGDKIGIMEKTLSHHGFEITKISENNYFAEKVSNED